MDKKEDVFFTPNQENTTTEKRKSNPTKIIVGLVAVIALAIFVVRPAILGYGVYQKAQSSNLTIEDYAQNMQELSRNLEVTKANLSSYSTFTGALLTELGEKSDELTGCKVELEQIQSNVEEAQKQVAETETELNKVKSETQDIIDQDVAEKTATLEEQKTTCENSLTTKEKEVSEIQAKYDLLIKNAAKSICCKAKVDNPQINFYDVIDGKISCLEQGTNQLNC